MDALGAFVWTRLLGIRGITGLQPGCDSIFCLIVGAVFEDHLPERLRIGQPPHGVEIFDAGEAVFQITVQSNERLIVGCLSPSLGLNSVSALAWSLSHYSL